MTHDHKMKILRWLAWRKHRHVERFCTGRCNTWVTPEEMTELVNEGLVQVRRPWLERPNYVNVPTQFYITDKGRRLVQGVQGHEGTKPDAQPVPIQREG